MEGKKGIQNYIDLLPKIKIEVAVKEELLEQAIDAIIDSASNDKIGDGKIFVTSLEEVIRIRTGERGKNAI